MNIANWRHKVGSYIKEVRKKKELSGNDRALGGEFQFRETCTANKIVLGYSDLWNKSDRPRGSVGKENRMHLQSFP